MTILFWNIKGRDLSTHIAALAEDLEVDLLILAECKIPVSALLKTLNPTHPPHWDFAPTLAPTKTHLFIRGISSFVRPQSDISGRLSLRVIAFPAKVPFLLGMVHLPSLMWRSSEDLSVSAIDIGREIRAIEEKLGHARTIVVGDFNMNPYALGLTSANGFNAVMERQLAKTGSRKVDGKWHPFFYNPMWSYMGDRSEGPPGTFFYRPSGNESLYWHMFDQVLLRPKLLEFLEDDGVEIVTTCKAGALHDHHGRPSQSDHLPIRVSLNY